MPLAIIIPTKNEKEIIPLLIKSLKKQTFQDFQIIIADHPDSIDNIFEIAEQYNCDLVKGGSPSVGRNNGAHWAIEKNFDLLMFVDADVILPSKSFLERAVEEFNQRKLDVAGTFQMPFNKKNLEYYKSKNFRFNSFYAVTNLFISLFENTKRPFMQQCMFVRADLYDSIGGFDERLGFGEDSEYAKKAARKGYRFGVLKKPGKILVSPRRLENKFWKMLMYYVYLNTKILFGYKFIANEFDYDRL